MVPGVEAGEAGDGAAGEGVDVDGGPHPRQVRHAVRGHLIPLHGDHCARNRADREVSRRRRRGAAAARKGREREAAASRRLRARRGAER